MSNTPEYKFNSEPFAYDPVTKTCTIRDAVDFPNQIFEIAGDIEVLDASFNHFSTLPDKLAELENLRIGFFSHNDFETIPDVLSGCGNLEMVGFKSCNIQDLNADSLPVGLKGLILTDNKIETLPENIGDLRSLRKLMLTGNQLTTLPKSLLRCTNLELVRLSLNQLSESPDWLFELPELGWYSDGSNPDYGHTIQDAPPEVSWNELQLLEEIGGSAKNKVFSAVLNGSIVAVKMFGPGITTDGLSDEDIRLCLLSGQHPNLIGGIGKLVGTPDEQQGLIMSLVPPHYTSLGYPPDFHTFTRDTFAPETQFSSEFVLQSARDIASALSHLSMKGIMHGDVYAHNIMADANGRSILGDFGAASQYIPVSVSGVTREKVDVKGYGYLLDDLISRVHASDASSIGQIKHVRDMCLNTSVHDRPRFSEIHSMLS